MATAPAPYELAERLGDLSAVDAPAEKISERVRALLPPGPVKDAVSGTWLGHTLHPLLTDVVVGAWTSALALDLVGGSDSEGAADKLIALGIVSYPPTALTGVSDWADSTLGDERVKRIGLVHAATNGTALALYVASLAARRSGSRGRGKLLSLAGAGMVGLGGYLGGHLSYAKGIGVDQTVFEERPEDWTRALDGAELAEGTMQSVDVAGADVLIARSGGRLHAMANTCTHRGGPLADGKLVDGCVECPWHMSRFRLEDGSVAQGPATSPQPAYDVREREGAVEVRSRPRSR